MSAHRLFSLELKRQTSAVLVLTNPKSETGSKALMDFPTQICISRFCSFSTYRNLATPFAIPTTQNKCTHRCSQFGVLELGVNQAMSRKFL
jgi:hypothetical protein